MAENLHLKYECLQPLTSSLLGVQYISTPCLPSQPQFISVLSFSIPPSTVFRLRVSQALPHFHLFAEAIADDRFEAVCSSFLLSEPSSLASTSTLFPLNHFPAPERGCLCSPWPFPRAVSGGCSSLKRKLRARSHWPTRCGQETVVDSKPRGLKTQLPKAFVK